MNMPLNRRILLIDDMASIHEDFRKIFRPAPALTELDRTEALLMGTQAPALDEAFELDSAFQGQEGLAMARVALEAGRPYAMAFVDMRMPPGWDGVDTIEHLWRLDPELQVVICTAHSDHPWGEVLARLDVRDRLLVVKKPFDIIEVSQLARTLTAKWTMAREAQQQTAGLEGALRDLKTVEGALRVSNRQLESYSYSVSHDLRAPLAAISGFSNMLSRRVDAADTKAVHYLARIMASATHMEQLIEGLLALAQVARVQLAMEPVDLTAVANETMERLQAGEPERAATIEVEAGLTAVGDTRLIRVVMDNLLSNAWKYTSLKEHTHIDVGQVRGTGLQPVFYVRDNGAGFDMAFAEKLFKSFQRLHSAEEFPGTGVGLATVQRVVERHGGHVWATAEPGKGAAFFFTLAEGSSLPQSMPEVAALRKDSRFGALA